MNLRAVLEIFLPPACDACGALTASSGFCGPCLAQVQAIVAPFCELCGVPLPFAGLERCDRCAHRQGPDHVACIRAAYVYRGPVRRCLLRLKQADLPATRRAMLQRFRQVLSEMPACDAVTCVPSSRRRLWMRGHNPAALWACEAARHLGKPLLTGALRRKPRVQVQKRLRRHERFANVQQAYVSGKDSVAGLRVLLIDDVISTGATIRACAAVLRAAGAHTVMAAAPALVPSGVRPRFTEADDESAAQTDAAVGD